MIRRTVTKRRKSLAAAIGVTCVVGAAGVGVVQAQEAQDGAEQLPTGYTVQPLAGEQNIDLKEVPPQVLHTADQAAKGIELKTAQVDYDDIEAVYEITGEGIEVDVKTNGRLEEIEQVVRPREVSREARRLLRSAFPGFDITKTERSTRPTEVGLLRVFYEFDGKTAAGEELDIEINQRGTAYTVEPVSVRRPAPGSQVPGTPPAGG